MKLESKQETHPYSDEIGLYVCYDFHCLTLTAFIFARGRTAVRPYIVWLLLNLLPCPLCPLW
ncbi:MAG: hypothetical protein ACRCYY_21365 [Trueperaceae bacterium]